MRCRIAVGIPTVGWAAVLRKTLRELRLQTRPADAVIVCGTKAADVEGAEGASPGVRLLEAEPGLPRQRNAMVAAAGDIDVVVFFDDDFLPDPAYLAVIERHMLADPQPPWSTHDDQSSAGPMASVAVSSSARHEQEPRIASRGAAALPPLQNPSKGGCSANPFV